MENSFSSYPLAAASSSTAPGPEKQGGGGGGGKGSKAAVKVKLSTDAQSVAARERRHRISERLKILQSLVPGGTKMDTVTMLEEAIHYVKFLKAQIWLHQTMIMSAAGAACLDAGAYPYGGHDHFPTSYAPQKLEDPYYCYDDDQVRGYADPALLQHGFVNSGSNYEDNMFDFS